MQDKFNLILLSLVVVLTSIILIMCSFVLGIRVGKSVEYHLILEDEDVEIVLETLDELISRQAIR